MPTIQRTLSARKAKSIFYEDFNDIDIFIEDKAIGYKKIYKEILIRAFSHTLTIDQVFPLGGREEVLASCRKNQSQKRRKRLYIIDGDLHLLNGIEEEEKKLEGLYILPRYCIENYLIDEEALAGIIEEEDPDLEKKAIKEKFEFEKWVTHHNDLLMDLFIIYALCFRHLSSEQTVQFKVTKLCSSPGILCITKTINRIEDLKSKLINKIGSDKLEEEIQLISGKINKVENGMLRYVSGKDYLMPLVTSKILSFAKFPVGADLSISIKIRLSRFVNIDDLKDIKTAISNFN